MITSLITFGLSKRIGIRRVRINKGSQTKRVKLATRIELRATLKIPFIYKALSDFP